MAGLPGIVIQIGAESRAAITEIDKTNRALQGMESSSSGAASHIRSMQAPAVAALGAIAGAGLYAANSASNLEQATGAMTAVFGPNTAAMAKAAEAANDLGLSTADYNQNAAMMGALLKNVGVSSDKLAGKTEDLIGTAADMAAQFGGSTTDAVGALQSMIKGQYDVMDNYGVKLTAADVSARAMADGTSNAEAAIALMNEQLAQTGTMGAASREMDTVASQTASAKAAFEDASAELGTALLPALTDLAGALKTAAEWIAENKTLVLVIVGVIGTFAAIIVTLNIALTAYALIQWAANTALLGFPLVWIVVAIAAVIAAVVLLWKNWDKITEFFKDTWQAITRAFDTAVAAIKGFFDDLWNKAKDIINKIINKINEMIDAFNRLPLPDIGRIPGLNAATAAVTPTATARGGRSYGPNVTVNVSGVITDPEGTAREIARILSGSTVRTGVTRVEGRRLA